MDDEKENYPDPERLSKVMYPKQPIWKILTAQKSIKRLNIADLFPEK